MRISLFSGRGTELVPGLTSAIHKQPISAPCLLYTSDAADELT